MPPAGLARRESILSLPLAICLSHVFASLSAPLPSSLFPPLHFTSSLTAFPILPVTPPSLTMEASHITVCLHTDRNASLKHPSYLAAVKRGEAHPAVTAFVVHEVSLWWQHTSSSWCRHPTKRACLRRSFCCGPCGKGAMRVLCCELRSVNCKPCRRASQTPSVVGSSAGLSLSLRVVSGT